MTPEEQTALRTARSLVDLGHPLDVILTSPLVPPQHRAFVRAEILREQNFTLMPARTIVADSQRADWLAGLDRSNWHYWPTLRQFLLSTKGWDSTAVRSLDDSSDRILRQLAAPGDERFDIRGLVLGFVQSGKTANYTALAAKAADAGYRLVVVLSGIDNGLRLQTNVRLKHELIGYPDNRSDAVRLPPMGQQWHEFTREDLHGDFRPGFANHAALQGTQPVLLVVKKNGAVLRRLLAWLDEAPAEVRQTIPLLVVDDEADQASVDTRGSYQTDDDDPPNADYEEPAVINGLIRDLLRQFQRRAYVAYTATPYANILIPHDAADPRVGNDLYPKDFIIDLPRPAGYFGAEEIFGRLDSEAGEHVGGMDIVEEVSDEDLVALEQGQTPESLRRAIIDFVLAGAARSARGQGEAPATMLIHTSQRILVQAHLRGLVGDIFGEVRDEWRYQRRHGIMDRLRERWNSEFRRVTRGTHADRDCEFNAIQKFIGPFLEAVQVREINSASGEVLDYQREPSLKAIAVGGNRLSRGLTLEGLMVSYFVRRSVTYDTLMQMGRWFGFRGGYEDLTRIYTTAELESWFADLALVEHRLREDIAIYETEGLTPREVGMRIWQHPTMQVTSRLKRRFATDVTLAQSYSLSLEQTFKFPLRRLDDLAVQAEANRIAVRDFVEVLLQPDAPSSDSDKGPVWTGVSPESVIQFLQDYRVDDQARSISTQLICAYITRMNEVGELVRWTVAVRARESRDATLGVTDWKLPGGEVPMISRSRIGETDSVGVITSPGDEAVGLPSALRQRAAELIAAAKAADKKKSDNSAAREVRPPAEGLLLLYPISRKSGRGRDKAEGGKNRRPLYDNPDDPRAHDLVGVAISFPKSPQPQTVQAYLQGSVGWRLIE
jgi:Z1 domain